MTRWTVDLSDSARQALTKLDRPIQKRIAVAFDRLEAAPEPSALCKPLTGRLAGLWRYRAGDWRLVCEINRGRLVILVMTIGHRSDVYDG